MAKARDLLPKNQGRKLSSLFPMPSASKIEKAKDAAGHEHGEGGRFVSMGESHAKAMSALAEHYAPKGNATRDPAGMPNGGVGRPMSPDSQLDGPAKAQVHRALHEAGLSLSGSKQTPKQRIEDKYTDPETGALDNDKAVAERSKRGHLPPPSTSVPEAVFNIGGGGVGKGAMTRELVGNGGEEDDDGVIIGPGHPEYQAPQAGFDPKRVFDADAEKKLMPLYSDQTGEKPGKGHVKADDPTMYGASGPKTGAELAKYSPEEQEAMHAYVRKTTKFKDAHDFGRSTITGPRDPNDPTKGHFNDDPSKDTEFDGGLTHELSSHIVKNKLMHAIAHPEEGSFVYDSVGNEKYMGWAAEARKNGFRSRFREAVHRKPTDPKTGAGLEIARPEVGQFRNQGRGRTVNPKLLAGTHRKAAIISPILNAHSRELNAAGITSHTHDHFPTMSDEDVNEALSYGMTPDGPPAGFEHPRKKAKRLAAERAATQARDDAVPK